MSLSIIVATAANGVIGKENNLPWHLPSEMARFKQTTMGHPIIMGRKTHESIGRALPGRRNIIISHDTNYRADDCEVVHSLDEAVELAKSDDQAFIVGGAAIYQQALPRVNKIYLTRVKANIEGDKYFKFDETGWKIISSEKHPKDEQNQYAYEVQEWVRK